MATVTFFQSHSAFSTKVISKFFTVQHPWHMLLHLPPAASTSVILYLCLTWQQLGCTKALTFFEDLDCVSLTFSFFFFLEHLALSQCYTATTQVKGQGTQSYRNTKPANPPPGHLVYSHMKSKQSSWQQKCTSPWIFHLPVFPLHYFCRDLLTMVFICLTSGHSFVGQPHGLTHFLLHAFIPNS